MIEFEDYKNQQKKIEAMKSAIKKLREWGRIGNNEKFFKRALSIEKRLEKMELYDSPEANKELPLDFQFEQRSGKDVLSIKDLQISFGDKVIFKNVKFYIKYGEKVCLMGKNGSGKSTLVKALLGYIKINNGEIKIGCNVKIGYIPQEIKFDDDNETVLSVAKKNFFGTDTQLRVLLSKFLFYGESVFKRVGQLSGGEKVRLKLLDLIQQKANFLILDEPTNHIDIETKEMLEESLSEYNGTVLFISHDRYFINIVAKRVLNIENNIIKEYQGNYDYFREYR
jgi:ATPase subunit of ABC transporter with duplicated ATPase domains